MKILVNIISGQTAPNFFAYKLFEPQKIINVYSKESIKQLQWLKKIINNVDFEDVEVDPYNYSDCKSNFKKIITQNVFNELILNFTNGTKIIAVAAFEAFQEKNLQSVYIDSEEMFLIKHRGAISEKENFSVKIDLKEYFGLYGNDYKLDEEALNNQDIIKRYEFIEFMLKNHKEYYKTFLDLARLNKVEKNRFLNSQKPLLKHRVEVLPQKNSIFIKFYNNKQKINYSIELFGKILDVLDFITGKWYEWVIFDKFKTEQLFNEIFKNIVFEYRNPLETKAPKNEIDIAAIRKNTLFIFEVKSGGVLQEHLNKVKTLKDYVGGRYCNSYIISLFNQKPEIEQRATDYGIELYYHKDLEKLINKIKQSKQNVHV